MTSHEPFGNLQTIGAEPAWYRGVPTPYYKATHVEYRNKVRAFIEKEMTPFVDEWIDSPQGYPVELHRKMYEAGISTILFPKEFGGNKEDTDYFHRIILFDEMGRAGGGMVAGQVPANSMSVPPILFCGSEELQKRIVPAVVRGEKSISLAISEPQAGSDVMNLQTTAVKSADGKSFIVNGQKKWITGGSQADYLTVAARTGEAGMNGLSLFVIDTKQEGVKIRKMKTQFDSSHSTTFITLEDVVVPIENLIGEENQGFMAIVQNFNSERFTIAVSGLRLSRQCYAESFRWAMSRETFGKKLIEHQLVRYRLAEMLRHIEALQDHVERVAFIFSSGVSDLEMGLDCSILKINSAKCLELCSRAASDLFGGSSLVQEGQGKAVERIFREINAIMIPGGATDILSDFAARDVERKYKKYAKQQQKKKAKL